MIRTLKQWEERLLCFADSKAPKYAPFFRKYSKIFRYLCAGGTAAAVDLAGIYILTDVIGIYYLLSAVLAFIIAFAVSFTLQKFWTFGDDRMDGIHSQGMVYLIVALINLGLNTFLMYAFVEWLNIWYLLSQVIASGVIAIESFFISRDFIFKH